MMTLRDGARLAGLVLVLAAAACNGLSLSNVTDLWPGSGSDSAAHSIPSGLKVPELRDAEMPLLGPIVIASLYDAWPNTAIPAMLESPYLLVYVALRQEGRRLSESWAQGDTGLEALQLAMGQARAGLDPKDKPNRVELVLAHGFEPVPFAERRRLFSNVQRGLWGLEITYPEGLELHAPSAMIASNRSFQTVVRNAAERLGLSEAQAAESLVLRRFRAEQILVSLTPEVAAERMFRGNRLVAQAEVTRASVAALAARMADWMLRNVHDDGRMTYKYWPSRGEESGANNMIRQWMASRVLGRIVRQRGDPRLTKLAALNLRYNLWLFYHEEDGLGGDGLGVIEFDGKAKLGAIALAALAIAEHPERMAFAAEQAALGRSIDHLWQQNGAFTTFLKPAGRDDNQNFYPGEALLYWARLYRETRDPVLLERILLSFAYYRDWHLANRNPAFVPWHTMAYELVWRETGDDELRDWIFEMNDWLLARQQPDIEAYPDTAGRFYDPDNPGFGPPHASSTGVYLEGLIRAFALARETGDSARAEAYRQAIVRGLRSLMQLEFADEMDMFYINPRDRVRGALRTTVYDNEIRVDNVQHGLMAILDILETFTTEDYRL